MARTVISGCWADRILLVQKLGVSSRFVMKLVHGIVYMSASIYLPPASLADSHSNKLSISGTIYSQHCQVLLVWKRKGPHDEDRKPKFLLHVINSGY